MSWCTAAAERIGKLVYLDAANPKNGDSLAELAGEMITTQRPLSEIVNGAEVVMVPETYDLMWQVKDYFGVEDPDDLAWLKERLTSHPWKTFEQPLVLTNEVALWAIPQYHIICESTLDGRDRQLMDSARAEGRLWHIDTGHDLMITEPDFVAGALMEIAAA